MNKIIKIEGYIKTGKTTALVNVVKALPGDNKLMISPDNKSSDMLKRYFKPEDNVTFVTARDCRPDSRYDKFDVIGIDRLSDFTPSVYGSYLSILLTTCKNSTIVYDNEQTIYAWKSTVKWWNPRTWGTGYYEIV